MGTADKVVGLEDKESRTAQIFVFLYKMCNATKATITTALA